MHRRLAPWEVKRPLFVGGLVAVAVTAIALKASLAVTLACVIPLILLLGWQRVWLCATIALCFLLLAVGYRHTYVLPAEQLDGQSDVIEGRVVESPTYGRMYTVRVTRSDYLPKGSRVMLRCTDKESLTVGDTIIAQAELLAVKDNQTYYASHRAFVCAFPQDGEGTLRVTHPAPRKIAVTERVRTALTQELRASLPTRESGLLAALCFGETTFVQDGDAAAFRGSGLSHILVVSGLHLSLVAVAIQRLLRRCGRYPCCILTLSAVWLFALLVGATPSILRAAVMLSLWLVGRLLFYRSDGLNSLGLAALLLLAANPYTLWNVGFQLSFAATLGVLLLVRRMMPQEDPLPEDAPWYRCLWRWLRHTLMGAAAVCAAALLFTLPIACYHYGGFPLTSLPANMLAAPVAGVTMLFGWLGAVCGLVPFLEWLSDGLLFAAGGLARYIAAVARLCSPAWAWVTVGQRWQWLLLIALCTIVTGAVLCRIEWRRVAVVLLTLTVLAVGVGFPWTAAPPRMTVVPIDNQSGFILQQGDHCALIITHARDIDEVVYDTPAFTPEIVVVLDGDPSVIPQMTRWPEARLFIATPAPWMTAADLSFTAMPTGSAIEMWEDCHLSRLSDGWVLLKMGRETVEICTDPQEPCPLSCGWQIYVGGLPNTPPDTPYTLVCNDTWLRRNHQSLTEQTTVIYDGYVTFTPLRGEWRSLLWR